MYGKWISFTLSILVLLVLGACSLQMRVSVPNAAADTRTTPAGEATAAIPTATTPPTATPLPTETPVVVCASPVTEGAWTGRVDLGAVASTSGVRVIQQEGIIDLALRVACDGSITGVASRNGSARITVPLMVNGTCTDQAQYDVTGVMAGSAAEPVVTLELATREGSLNCDINSRLSSVPSGQNNSNLAGERYVQALTSTRTTQTRLEGSNWPDRLYQQQIPELETLLTEAGLTLDRTSTWWLEYQGP